MQPISPSIAGTAAIDFAKVAANMPLTNTERLNRCAQLAGYGHPFSPSSADARQRLSELMVDPMFQLAFVEFHREDLSALTEQPAAQAQQKGFFATVAAKLRSLHNT